MNRYRGQAWIMAAVTALLVGSAAPARAVDDLSLNVAVGSQSVQPGDIVTVTLDVANLSLPINGVQILINYDNSVLSLIDIVPTDLILPAPDEGWAEVYRADNAGDIDYAVVINGDSSQADQTVATLTFMVIDETTPDTAVTFRPDADPIFTKLTALDNSRILPNLFDSGSIVSICDDGLACTFDAFVGGICQFTIESAGLLCRASTDLCDPAELCDGISGACPSDALEPAGTVCRASTDLCDAQETCTGVSAACPADVLEPAGTVCRGATGLCDPEEVCDGLAASCPVDLVEPTGTVCRASTGVCDPQETCDGATGTCPLDALEPASTVCGASSDLCDAEETCDGVSASCPADVLEPAGTVCRASAGLCDPEEVCDGLSPSCAPDVLESGGVVCRFSVGLCDPDEACDGVSASCPADFVSSSGTPCRLSTGPCDPAEVCDGGSGFCPADAMEPGGTVCRASTGPCDPDETCDGASAACPVDALEPSGAVCRASTGLCDPEETCDGVSVSCPADALELSGTVCRVTTGLCDLAETCDGLSAICPADAVEPLGTACSDGSFCNGLETCDGLGVCLAATDPCAPSPCDEVNDVCIMPIHVANIELFYAGRFRFCVGGDRDGRVCATAADCTGTPPTPNGTCGEPDPDPSRSFLATGSTATIDNISNYARGITGIRVSFDNIATFATTTDAAFSFEWTEPTGTVFSPVTDAATAITVTPTVVGGVTVVDIVLANDHVRQRWLKVTIDATEVTAGGIELDGELSGNPVVLSSGDGTAGGNAVFYIGNTRGDVTGDRKTTLTDVGQIRLLVNPALGVPIDSVFDVDKSGKVQLTDVGYARLGVNPAFQLPLISP